MNKSAYKIGLVIALLLGRSHGHSQAPAFYHLSTDNGLYDNHVRSLTIDRQGFLWIGTEEGLNVYDGHSFNVYLKDKYPGMPSNHITHLFSDSSNRLWVGTGEGVASFNNRKQFSRVVLNDSVTKFVTWSIFQTKTKGMVLISNLGHFYLDEKKNKWMPFLSVPSELIYNKIRAVRWYDADKVLFATDSSMLLYDYAAAAITQQFPVKGVKSMCKLKGNEFAFISNTGEVATVNIDNGKIYRQYQLGKTNPVEMKQAANGDLVIATGFNGLVIIDSKGTISSYVHNPVVPTSLISNSTYRIATGANGEVIIGTSTSGVSMYNTNLNQAGFHAFFRNKAGDFYDNYTGAMLEDGDMIWIGAYDRLIKWNRKENIADFYFDAPKDTTQKKGININALYKDRSGTFWVGLEGKGLAWFLPQTGRFHLLKPDTMLSPVFKSRNILDISQDHTGLLWICSSKGVFTIDPVTKKAIPPADDNMGRELSGKIINAILIDSKQQKWFASIGNGIYCFDKTGKQLLNFTEKDGLPSNTCYMIKEDKKGRFFVTTAKGFSMLNEKGVIRTLTKENSLRYERCESVVIDDEGIVWFSNKKCLVRYDPDNNTRDFFDERSGLLNNGFRVGSCLKTSSGELFWGGYRGISYFDPKLLKNVSLPLRVSVYGLQLKDTAVDISAATSFKTAYANNSVNFFFAGIHLGIPGKTYYQYRLKGFDNDWQKGEDISQARYSALPPGTYVFEMKASMDGMRWVEAPQHISITVVPPLWMRWWFIVLILAMLTGLACWFVRNRNKKIKQQQEDLETEKAINYFANSLHEQQTVETILWDVARNCIGRLQFEDCVVYLVDEDKKVLVQKAAYGPKSPKNFRIAEPLEIPMGKGITGTVAVTGQGEIVADTSQDNRYIIDDTRRLSEIAVPIISGNKVIGVIDCEHQHKNYFTQKHLSILTTIASLCANKIIRARAEEEKQQAQLVLTDTQQKMAEVEMQALRAQMNPHFIFNCLNSINRYIVKSDQATASLYLTRFAKLIRLILDNSANKNVSLSNELEALKLYIEMEALRFDKKFTYDIIVDKNVSTDSIEVPPLIIQPYVENAIWHGLLHKEGGGKLTVSIKLSDDAMLECTVEDNGVGRNKAAELKSKSATSRKSLGMQITNNRLALLNRHAELNASITITDLVNNAGEATGTRVVLLIPV